MASVLSQVGAAVTAPVKLVQRAVKNATSGPKDPTMGMPLPKPAGDYDKKSSAALAKAALKQAPAPKARPRMADVEAGEAKSMGMSVGKMRSQM